jgi:hypothetical protein
MSSYGVYSVGQDSLSSTVQGYAEETRSTSGATYQNNVTVKNSNIQNTRVISGSQMTTREQTVATWMGQFQKNTSQGYPRDVTCTIAVTDSNIVAADSVDLMTTNSNTLTLKSISLSNTIGVDVVGSGYSSFHSGYLSWDGIGVNLTAGQVQPKPTVVKQGSETLTFYGTYSLGKEWSFNKVYIPPQNIPVPVVPICGYI